MDQNIVVVDEKDNILEVKSRDIVDKEKLRCRVTALWIKNSKGENLLARRAYTKTHYVCDYLKFFLQEKIWRNGEPSHFSNNRCYVSRRLKGGERSGVVVTEGNGEVSIVRHLRIQI